MNEDNQTNRRLCTRSSDKITVKSPVNFGFRMLSKCIQRSQGNI